MGRKKEKEQVEDETEDWCFVCKDGGRLLICDRKGCGKAYHPGCVGRKNSVLKSEGRWTCSRHKCSMCGAAPQFYCLCCPAAVCELCVEITEFVCIKFEKGLCKGCLNRALDSGQNPKFDSERIEIDSEDSESDELMFIEYLEIKMKQEGLTYDDLRCAHLKRENHGSGLDLDKIEGKNSVLVISVSDGDSDEDSVAIDNSCGKRKKSEVWNIDFVAIDNSCIKRKKSEVCNIDFAAMDRSCGKTKKSEVRENVGWGSKPLINFLKSVGKDVTKKLSKLYVYIIISNYILENYLFREERKIVVLCDEKLRTIFQKEKLQMDEMINLLDEHFVDALGQVNSVENEHDKRSSSGTEVKQIMPEGKRHRRLSPDNDHLGQANSVENEDDKGSSSRTEVKQIMPEGKRHRRLSPNNDNLGQANSVENEDNKGSSSGTEVKQIMTEGKRHRRLSPDNVPLKEKVHGEVQKNSYASMVVENIKLVYLRRSLVEELLKHPDNFENKVVGSFIRVKTNSGNCSEKTSFHLLQVTGVKSLNAEINRGVLLEVSCMPSAIPVDMLDDDDISKEECDDLRQRVKDGLLRKLTVAEFEQKAEILQVDITNNWIQRELVELQKRIDFAREKGMRNMLDRTLAKRKILEDERKMLEDPSERQRLVILEEIELAPAAADSSESKGGIGSSKPQSSTGNLSDNGA